MLTRRSVMAAGAAAATVPWGGRARATPPGIIVMALAIDDIISFDPAQAYEFSDEEANANIYQKLVSPVLTDLTKMGPDLAQAWEVSSDGKTFTFHLSQNAMFPSGKPATAADAEFSLHRVITLNLTPGFILTQFGFTKDNVAQMIRATDPHTLVIELPKQAAPSLVLNCLGAGVGSIVEKATALAHQEKDDLGNKWLSTHSAGTGPYQLTDWKADDHIILDANPHAAKPPATKRFFVRHIKEPSEQLLALRRGDVDIARNLTSELLKTAATDSRLYNASSPTTNQMYIGCNAGFEPFKKVEVRQAIKWAIDYEGIQKNIAPMTYIVAQAFEPTMILGAVNTNPFKKDPARAKELLAKAGYPQGFNVTMDHFSEVPFTEIAAAVQADLGEVGIKVSLLPATQKQVFTKMRARQHQMIMSEWYPDYFDPNSNAQAFNADPDDGNSSPLKIIAWRNHFYDPELTKEVAEAAKEVDTEKRVELYHKMQEQAWEVSSLAFMLQQNAVAVIRKGVSGFWLGPQSDFVRYGGTKKV